MTVEILTREQEKGGVVIERRSLCRMEVGVDGWVNETSDFNAGDDRLFLVSSLFLKHDHDCSLTLTK